MNSENTSTLIVGSDSLLGKALMAYYNNLGIPVTGTTRNQHSLDDKHIFLDLSHINKRWSPPENIGKAIICAGITNVGECEKFPTKTRHINVDGISQILEILHLRNIFFTYLSSNRVFDGHSSYCKPNDPTFPNTEYGKQKRDVEAIVQDITEYASVIRLTKVLQPQNPLFQSWVEALSNNTVIRPILNTVLSPIPIDTAIHLIAIITENIHNGIWHLSGDTDIAYVDIANAYAKSLGASVDLVQPIPRENRQPNFSEPYNTTLDSSHTTDQTGVEAPSSWSSIQSTFDAIRGVRNGRN